MNIFGEKKRANTNKNIFGFTKKRRIQIPILGLVFANTNICHTLTDSDMEFVMDSRALSAKDFTFPG